MGAPGALLIDHYKEVGRSHVDRRRPQRSRAQARPGDLQAAALLGGFGVERLAQRLGGLLGTRGRRALLGGRLGSAAGAVWSSPVWDPAEFRATKR
jgi:hypothetical protein